MNITSLAFYCFATVLVLAATRVVTTRNPVHAALFLVLSFFSASGLWMILQAEFLAITLVLVYVGAVMVLFLFVVMMLDINIDAMRVGFKQNLPVALLVGLVVIFELAFIIISAVKTPDAAQPPVFGAGYSNTRELGKLVYTEYVYPFEIAAVILLVAIIAAIALTLRKRKDSKWQNISEQVAVKKSDRVRLVSMKAVKEIPVAAAEDGAKTNN
jgi:NADH-quinone oxidoreductase subunit J